VGQTIVEKIAQSHMTDGPQGRDLRAGDFLTIRPRHILTHDNTAPVMKKFKSIGAPRVADPRQPVFVLDHDIQNRSEENLAKYRAIEAFAGENGVDFYPAGSGIGHQVMCEQLYVVPGSFVVGSDSHSNMYGAMGAVGTPVVRTDAAAVWATEEFWWQIPRTVQVVLEGALPEGASGKDVILALCGLYNQGEVLNAAVEFAGPGVGALSLDERMSIANMTTEWGALVGWFPADAATLRFIRARKEVLDRQGIERVSDEEIGRWESDPPRPDPDAAYSARITLDLSEVTPTISGPDTVQVMTPLADVCLPGITRALVIRLGRERGIPVVEKNVSMTEVYTADEVFTSGTMGELTVVTEVDGRRIVNRSGTSRTTELQDLHAAHVRATGYPIPW